MGIKKSYLRTEYENTLRIWIVVISEIGADVINVHHLYIQR